MPCRARYRTVATLSCVLLHHVQLSLQRPHAQLWSRSYTLDKSHFTAVTLQHSSTCLQACTHCDPPNGEAVRPGPLTPHSFSLLSLLCMQHLKQ
jgi:hypothetical protein